MSTDIDSAATSAAVSLDDAVEAITVAIGLGMVIPAVHGMQMWKAGFTSNSVDSGYQFEVDDCATEAAALVRVRNEILPTLLRTYRHAYSLQEKMLKGRTLEDYITNSTTMDLAIDYAEAYSMSFYCYPYTVDGTHVEPLSVEEATKLATTPRHEYS